VSDTESRETPVLRIEVDDTGPGMTPKQARNLFQPFTQADSTVTRRHGGTGLGLTICRRLAGLMHGTVRLDRSVPGEGSRFVVELPLIASVDTPMVDNLDVFVRRRPAPNAHITTLATGRLRGRILLAEDGEDNRRLITYHLTKAGAVVDVAVNGRVALDLLEASRLDGRPYDLLVTDMQMPVMDGYTLARTLRKRGSVLPIVALTAHAMAEDREKCIEAGCNDYATKPIDRARLIATCAAWLPPDDGAPNAPVDPVPAVATSRAGNESARSAEDVLISDLADDPDMLPLVHEFLRQLPDRMALFDTHREPEQRSALASAAHQMKGAAGGYGYMSISELARTVERFASAGGTQAECDKAINALLSRCRAAIRGGLPADAAGMTTQGMTP
jgi:CheY-like chemotaxis protein